MTSARFFAMLLRDFCFALFFLLALSLVDARGVSTNMGMDHVGFTVRNATESMDFLMKVFDCVFDWEVIREPRPNAGERGWATLFDLHDEAYLKHVVMLKCGDYHLTQYIELFEWVTPDQALPANNRLWQRFSDLGHGYISFTVKDVFAVVDQIKKLNWPGVRIIQDPPMNFPLRGETCTSTFIVSPWGQWIELTQWSISGPQGQEIRALRSDTSSEECKWVEGEQSGSQEGGYACGKDYKRFSEIGMKVEDLETPAMLVDLDAMDHNVALMTQRMKEKNVDWRPPVKAHKSPALARRLIKAGAKGILVLKLSEAEIFAEEGFDDIYLANIIVDDKKIRRLAVLARKMKRLRIHVDDEDNVRKIAASARDVSSTVEILAEVNIGHNRTGVAVENVLSLVQVIVEEEKKGGIKFVGLAGYEGHTPIMAPEAKTQETKRGHGLLAEAKKILENAGIPVQVVTAGGSSNYIDALEAGVITELEAGGGALVDNLYMHKAHLGDHGHRIGVFVLSQVVSVPKEKDRATADAGFKACGMHPFSGLPTIHGRDDLEVSGLSAEHLRIRTKDSSNKIDLAVGQKLFVVPGYTDVMGFGHRRIYAFRNGIVEDVWPILAAGALA